LKRSPGHFGSRCAVGLVVPPLPLLKYMML
jgi:hypothetical protein